MMSQPSSGRLAQRFYCTFIHVSPIRTSQQDSGSWAGNKCLEFFEEMTQGTDKS